MGTSKTIYDYDVTILGGGSAGYAAARTAAGAGLKTVVIEGSAAVGGLCILRGCMPTKTLLYAAEVMHLAGHPEPWGNCPAGCRSPRCVRSHPDARRIVNGG